MVSWVIYKYEVSFTKTGWLEIKSTEVDGQHRSVDWIMQCHI